MASKKEEKLRAGAANPMLKFFSAADKEDAQEAAKEQAEQPQEEPEPVKAEKHTDKEEKPVTEANTKPKKQVFSFRGEVTNIKQWKAYATATGRKMEDIGTKAMTEYLKRHPLKGQEKKVFDVLMESVDK